MILVKAYMAITRREGEIGSHCLGPLPPLKQPTMLPFKDIENLGLVMQSLIHITNFTGQPAAIKLMVIKFQFTKS